MKGEASFPSVEVDGSQSDSSADLHLILSEGRLIEGFVYSSEGFPVSGAEVELLPMGRLPSGRRHVTDAAGHFRERVASDSSSAMVRVMAPSQLLWTYACRSKVTP